MVDEQLSLSIGEQKGFRDYIDWLEHARATGTVSEALKQYYANDSEHLYRTAVDGDLIELPLMTDPDWIDLDGSLNDFVGNMTHDETRDHHDETIEGIAEEMYVRRRGVDDRGEPAFFRTRDVLWNNRTYRMTGFSDPDDVAIQLEHSDFYSYVSSQERLLRELHHVLQQADVDHPKEVRRCDLRTRLSLRNQQADSFDALTNWSNHFYNADAVCLLAVNRLGKPPEVYLVDRSWDVLHEPGATSVAPSGSLSGDSGLGPDFQQAVIRELVEELMGVSEAHHPDASRSNELEQRVWAHVVAGQITVHRTAFGLSLDSPRPTFAGLVFVRDSDVGEWMREQLQMNWEFKQLHRLELPLDGVPERMTGAQASTPGAFSFYEGLRRLEQFGIDTGVELEVLIEE